MSAAENKKIALSFLEALGAGRPNPAMADDKATFWSLRQGEVPKDRFFEAIGKASTMAPNGVKMTIHSTTAEDDRVSIEATGDCTLTNGRKYDNTYHFMFVLKDGKILKMREYNDPRLAEQAFGGG